jgi:hypothetical protein
MYGSDMGRSIEDAIFALLAERDPGKTICPSEAARSAWSGPEPEGWRGLMPQVRSTAVGLARSGRLVITRKGKAADPNSFKGVYRLRLPDGEAS